MTTTIDKHNNINDTVACSESSNLATKPVFRRFGIVGAPRNIKSYEAHCKIFTHLKHLGYEVYIDQNLQSYLTSISTEFFKDDEFITKNVDLVIVVGGDGNFLHSAIRFAPFNIPLIGVNKGNLGFLAEIDPENVEQAVEKLVSTEKPYYLEKRTLLDITIDDKTRALTYNCHKTKQQNRLNQNQDNCDDLAFHSDINGCNALVAESKSVDPKTEYTMLDSLSYTVCNELTIKGSGKTQIIEVEVFIDGKCGFSMRGDGLIIATPTGSTAHNISAGGPIVNGGVEAVILTPLSAHNLTTRPIVIPATSVIEIHFKNDIINESVDLFCDGVLIEEKFSNHFIRINSSPYKLQMIHFDDYNYYSVLAKKLSWARRLF